MLLTADPEIIERARAGDPEAITTLVEAYRPSILGYLSRLVGDREIAEELTQDAFLSAYRGLPATRPDLQFGAWLYRIATNAALSHFRKGETARTQPLTLALERAQRPGEGSQLDRIDIERVLRQLPAHYSEALLLRHYCGLSTKGTARALGTTESAVKLRLLRARKAFAEAYTLPAAA